MGFLPKRLRAALLQPPLRGPYLRARGIYHFFRTRPIPTRLLGPYFKRSHVKITIDILYGCNLTCSGCNRSSAQAPSGEKMTLEQIKKFTRECIETKTHWKYIEIGGGEPTLHPEIHAIIAHLLEYSATESPGTEVILFTNGHGKTANRVLSELPKELIVMNSAKVSSVQAFHPFNEAPVDTKFYSAADFSNGCAALKECGVGLTPYGYYQCPQAGGIDRIFGLNIGRKTLPSPEDKMIDQMKSLCGLCGHFIRYKEKTTEGTRSKTWIDAYRKYSSKKPILSRYGDVTPLEKPEENNFNIKTLTPVST